MSKKRAIKMFIFTILCCIVGIIFAVCSFIIPFSGYIKYNGFANSIQLGLDLKGGVVAVYDVKQLEDGDLDNQIDATINRLTSKLVKKGYSESTVTKQGDNQIRIEVPDVDDPETLLQLISTPDLLELKKEEGVEKDAVITGRNIKNATMQNQEGEYGVVVEFDSTGRRLFKELTEECQGKQIYIYLGADLISSPTVNEVIAGGSTFISGSMDKQEATNLAEKILSGTYAVQLIMYSHDVVSPTLGEGAIESSVLAGIIGLLLVFIVMFLLYGELGLLANLTLIIYALIMIFLMQAIPLVQLTLPGIAGLILSIGMAVDGNIIIFERIKEEYRNGGKKMQAAFSSGFKKSVSAILDGNITTIIAAIVLLFLGTGPVQGFAIVLMIGIIVSLFTSLVCQRSFLNMYVALNPSNPKRAKLTKENNVNEI